MFLDTLFIFFLLDAMQMYLTKTSGNIIVEQHCLVSYSRPYSYLQQLNKKVSPTGWNIEVSLSLGWKLDWTRNAAVLYRKCQSRLFFLWRLRSLNLCGTKLWMFFSCLWWLMAFSTLRSAAGKAHLKDCLGHGVRSRQCTSNNRDVVKTPLHHGQQLPPCTRCSG